jgi:hypothetical protein
VRPYLQNNQRKRASDEAQVVEQMLSKYKVLNSSHSTTKRKKMEIFLDKGKLK